MDANYVFLVGNINNNNNNNNNINSNNSESLTGKQSVVSGAAAMAVGAPSQQQQQSPTDAEILMIPTSNLQKFIENADKILKNMTSNSSNMVASGSLPSEQRTGWYSLPSMGVACGIETDNLTSGIRSLCLFTNLLASRRYCFS